jgi:hypothetical protein
LAAITGLDDLVNLLSGGGSGAPETLFFLQSYNVAGVSTPPTGVANWYLSGWSVFDKFPAQGVTPTVAANPGLATQGAIGQTDPAGGRTKWLVGAMLNFNNTGSSPYPALLYDRLAHIGGLDATLTSPQTCNISAVRYTGAAAKGNWIMVENYVQIGGTARGITASYTNPAGASGRTSRSINISGSASVQAPATARILPLQQGDTGVDSEQSITLNGSTGAAGNFGISIIRPIAWLNGIAASLSGKFMTYPHTSIIEVKTDACLSLLYFPCNLASPEGIGSFSFVEK